jgi:hypothetical protein
MTAVDETLALTHSMMHTMHARTKDDLKTTMSNSMTESEVL